MQMQLLQTKHKSTHVLQKTTVAESKYKATINQVPQLLQLLLDGLCFHQLHSSNLVVVAITVLTVGCTVYQEKKEGVLCRELLVTFHVSSPSHDPIQTKQLLLSSHVSTMTCVWTGQISHGFPPIQRGTKKLKLFLVPNGRGMDNSQFSLADHMLI